MILNSSLMAESEYHNMDRANGPDSRAQAKGPCRWLQSRWLLRIWAVLAVIWVTAVAMNLYDRARSEASASREITRDLDAISCVGSNCAGDSPSAQPERWQDVTATYLQFGYVKILEWMLAPPVILLAGLGSFCAFRRRADRAV
jgi:hypothetical protein